MPKINRRVKSVAKLKDDALKHGKQVTHADGSVFNSSRMVAKAKPKKPKKAENPPAPNIEPTKPASAVPPPAPIMVDNSGIERQVRALADTLQADSAVTRDLLQQIAEKKPTTIQRHGWRFTFHRDMDGHVEFIDADPKFLTGTTTV